MHVRSRWISLRGTASDEPADEQRSGALDDQLALERALDAVADVARAVVWLHDVEGYTHGEIGQMMGRTASFSKSQLARAHERLRVLLEGPEVEGETTLCTPELKIC
jgi:RNA polymerase sigma-70 factor (ECF subfamily)